MAESGNEIKRENSVDRAFGGLISADDGNGDTSVHHSAVRCDGFRNLNQGEAVDNGSAKAENVTGFDDGGSIVVSSEGFESTVEGENEVKRGTVKWFCVQRGFGFITADDGSGDIFVHHSAIRCNGFRSLDQGEAVEFHLGYRDDGRAMAANVTGPDGGPVRCERDRCEQMLLLFKRLKIDNAATLSLLVSHIFEKAITEPTSCEMYANVCSHLAADLPEFESDNRRITFKRLILNNCQAEFEGIERTEDANNADEVEVNQTEEQRIEAGRRMLEDANNADKVEVNQTEEQRIEARRRTLGNIRFIGELYKVRMLPEKIMHCCIIKLLGSCTNPDEENIEALCVLMNIVGEMIDHSKAKKLLDAYFDRMRELSGNMKLCSRVRLMLVDTISLRKFGWNQRRQAGDAIGLPRMRQPEVLWYKSMVAIKKFYSTRDEKDVALRIKDLNSASFYPSMISLWIVDSFERNDMDRDRLTKCLINLSEPKEDGIISRDNLIEGIESVLVVLEDAVNDAPKAAEYLGRTLAKLILAHSISLSEIGRLVHEGGDERGRLVEIGLGAEVMGAVLDTITSEKDDSVLNEMLAESNLELGKFRPYRSCRLDKYI